MKELSINQEKVSIEENKNIQLKQTFQKINTQQQLLLKEYNDCGLSRLEELIKAIQSQSLEKIQDKIKNSKEEVEELNQQMQGVFFEELQAISQEYSEFKQHVNKEILRNLRDE